MDAENWVTLIIGLITGLGIGSLITALLNHYLKRIEAIHLSQRQEIEKRYKVIILLMYAAIDFEKNQTSLRAHRPNLTNQKLVLEELEAERVFMLLFASEDTLENLQKFIHSPNKDNLEKTALAMRNHLGIKKINLNNFVEITTELPKSNGELSNR